MDEVCRAFIAAMMARAALHVARDAEGQVAHWCNTGQATYADVRRFRKLTRTAEQAHALAQRRYREALAAKLNAETEATGPVLAVAKRSAGVRRGGARSSAGSARLVGGG